MNKWVLALVALGAVLVAPRHVRADDFCYTGWYEIDRVADGECDRVIYFCQMTGATAVEYDCTPMLE